MEDFDYMTNCSYLLLLVIEDLKLWLSLIDALDLMVSYWSNISSYDIMSSLVVEFTFYWIPFDCMFMIDLLWVSTYPLEVFNWFPIDYPCSPFQWLYHPNLGLWFLTSLMIFFSLDECPNMFRRSRNILPRIFKLLSFHLIEFWRWWLFNYPLTFTINFPISRSIDWHGTKGVPY